MPETGKKSSKKQQGTKAADMRRTKAELAGELASLRRKVARLEKEKLKGRGAASGASSGGPGGNSTDGQGLLADLHIKNKAIETSVTAMAFADLQGRITFVNRAFLEMWGYGREDEALGRMAVDFWRHREEPEAVMAELMSKGSWSGEMEATRADGSSFMVSLSASLVRDGGGAPAMLMGTFVDITAHRLAESALRDSEERTRAIIETAVNPIIVIDERGMIEAFNPASEKVLGYSASEVIGRNVSMLMPEPHSSRHDDYIRSYLNTGRKRIIGIGREVAAMRKDGTEVPAQLAVSEFSHAGAMRFVGILTDLTDRKRAEDAYIRSKRALDEAQRIAHVGSWEWDIAGGGLTWSDEIYRIFGLVPQEFGASYDGFLARVHPVDREYVRKAVNNALDGVEDYDIEHRIARPDGTERIVHEKGEITRSTEGRPMSMLGTVHDITEHKLLELELERKVDERTAELKEKNSALEIALRDARAADQAKSQFLAGISHELRTPLNGIIGLTELVLDSAATGEMRDNLSMVLSSAESLLTIINDLLDFSKITARKLDLATEPFSLRHTFGDAVNFYAHMAQDKGVSLLFDVEANVPDSIVGDPVRLNQVLTNLIGNAIKFTREGTICVKAALVRLGADEAEITFSVTDTGIGIPRDKFETIFETFTQADGSISRNYGGTGLGLSIANALIRMMGGRITLQSELGQGSTFGFTLGFPLVAGPVLPKSSETGFVLPAASSSGRRVRILLAEDNEINQKLAVRMLSRAGYDVDVANNGIEALAAMEAGGRFDLVLMDVMMPGMDGFDATREIRRREAEGPSPRLPVIAMTADAMKGTREKCIEAGMDDYIAKPIRTRELLAAIGRALA